MEVKRTHGSQNITYFTVRNLLISSIVWEYTHTNSPKCPKLVVGHSAAIHLPPKTLELGLKQERREVLSTQLYGLQNKLFLGLGVEGQDPRTSRGGLALDLASML